MKTSSKIAIAAVALTSSLMASTPSFAVTTVLATTEFNGSQGGTSGNWFYGQLVGSPLMFQQLTPSAGSFIGTDQFNTPLVANETTDIFVHPGDHGEFVDVRYIAPTAGKYFATFTGRLSDTSCGSCGGTDGVTLSVGGQTALLTHASYLPSTITTGVVTLAQGAYFDFAVNPNGNFYYDSTKTIISISAVPEPATWAFFFLGFGAIGWTLRGNRRQKMVAAA